MRYFLLAAFAATVLLANWLVEEFGLIPVGFGLEAPAAVLAVGVALALRDAVHEALGRAWVFVGIAIGAILSLIFAAAFAVPSAVAFTVSEIADFLVYEPLRRRGKTVAVLASNVVGAVVDSVLFLWLAPLPLSLVPGQIVGKVEVTLVVVAGMLLWRSLRR